MHTWESPLLSFCITTSISFQQQPICHRELHTLIGRNGNPADLRRKVFAAEQIDDLVPQPLWRKTASALSLPLRWSEESSPVKWRNFVSTSPHITHARCGVCILHTRNSQATGSWSVYHFWVYRARVMRLPMANIAQSERPIAGFLFAWEGLIFPEALFSNIDSSMYLSKIWRSLIIHTQLADYDLSLIFVPSLLICTVTEPHRSPPCHTQRRRPWANTTTTTFNSGRKEFSRDSTSWTHLSTSTEDGKAVVCHDISSTSSQKRAKAPGLKIWSTVA